MKGVRKAAILVSLLDDDAGSLILKNLPEEDLQPLLGELATLEDVSVNQVLEVLEEYRQMVGERSLFSSPGYHGVHRLLTKALGESEANGILERLRCSMDGNTLELESLKKADPQGLVRFLAGERSQTRAFVLRHLDTKQASALLERMEPEVRADCVRRLANLGQFSPDVAGRVLTILNRRIRAVGDRGKSSNSTYRTIAELMNHLDSASARETLDSLEREEPKLAMEIRDLMFTFEDFLEVPEPELRELMNAVDKKVLMMALKGGSEDLKSHFYRTMSTRAVEIMKEDADAMGPVRSKDVLKAQAEIVAIARKLEAEGKIVLKSEGEDEYVF